MMHEPEKSDLSKVAGKPTNACGRSRAEPVERREGAEGNTGETSMRRTPSRVSMFPGLDRVRERAKREKKERFTALLHHVDVDLLRAAFSWLKRDAAPGVDGLTWREYEQNLEARLVDLHARVHRGAYRALPSRRKFIPKGEGHRPLGVAALEDKIVQRAVVEVLNAIYEADFLGFSYGFRPGRSQHDALDALAFGITRTKVDYILDCDVRSFFDSVSHEWLVRFLEHRIGDPRVIRLIRKWLKAGVMADGKWAETEIGTPQGSVNTPWTQKRTSTLNAGSPGGGASRWLTLDVKSIILMSHGAIHASAKGAKVERGLSTTLRGDERGGGGRDAGARTRDLSASRISISRGSRTTQAACRSCRASTSHYVQDLRCRHPRAARVCGGHQLDAERGCNTRHHGVRDACAPTWLRDCANAVSASNTPSIVSSTSSSNRSTSFSSRIMRG